MKTFWWFTLAVLGVCVLAAPVSDIRAKFAKKLGLNKAITDPTTEKYKRSALNNQQNLKSDAVKKRVVYYPEFVDVEYYDHSNNVVRDKFFIDEWDKEDKPGFRQAHNSDIKKPSSIDCDGFLLDGNKDLYAEQIFDLIGEYPETDDFDDFDHVITNILDKVDYLNEEEQEKLMAKLEKYLSDDGDWERIVEAVHSDKVTEALIAEPDKQTRICVASRISHGLVNEGNDDVNTAADDVIPSDDEILLVESDDIADEEGGVLEDIDVVNEEEEAALDVIVNDGEEFGVVDDIQEELEAATIIQEEEEQVEAVADSFDVDIPDEEVGAVDDIQEELNEDIVTINQEEEEQDLDFILDSETANLEANAEVAMNDADILTESQVFEELAEDVITVDDTVNADTIPDAAEVVEEALIVDEQPIANEVNLETINGEIFFIEFPNESNEKPYKPSNVETQIIKPTISYKPTPTHHHHVPVIETDIKLIPVKESAGKHDKVLIKDDVVLEKPPLSEAKRDLGIELQKVSDKKQRMNLLYQYLAEKIKYAVKEVGSHVDDDIELESHKDIDKVVKDKPEVEYIDYEYKILEALPSDPYLATPHSPTYVTNNIQQFSQQVPTNIGSHTSQLVQPNANLQPSVMQPAPFVQFRQFIPDQFQPQQYSLYSPYTQVYPTFQAAGVTDSPTTPYPLDKSVHPAMPSCLTQLLAVPTVLPPYHYEPFTNHERILHINDGSSTVRNNPHTYNPVSMVQEVGRH